MLKLSQGLHQSSQHRWFQHAQVLIFSLVAVVVLAITSASPEAHAKRGRTKAEATAEDQQSAAPKRNASFAIAPEHGLIGIPVSAVEQGKEYLLSVSMIPQFGSATSHGNISRIVTFVRKGNDVIMLESTQGQVVTRDLPAKQILAIFSGAGSEAHEGLYLLKWDQGMTRLMFGGDWFTSDLSGKGFDIGERSVAIRAHETYVDDMKLHPETGTVEIRQILQLSWPTGVHYPNFEARYYLKEYKQNQNFQPKETTNFKRVGFFESNPQIEQTTGRTSVKISKWSIEKPITYYISANTPAEYVEAVRDGILYWNKAFGREVMKVEMAPAGVTAPDPNYNIVQWVPWDLAGSAYADAQMDPRTGEILHAQIYMTSAFAAGSKSRLRFILQNLKKGHNHNELGEHSHDEHSEAEGFGNIGSMPLPKAFQSARLCNYNMNQSVLAQLQAVANDPNSTDADVLRLTQNYIREVVAHEVGHTLGLRHNFAGTLAANITFDQRDAIFNKLLTDPKNVDVKNVEVTSSVMAYTTFRDAVIEGQRMKDSKEAFAYDKLAIQFSYLEDKQEHQIDRETAPIFCTDSHVNQFSDCRVFTSGPSPLANAMWEQNQILKDLAGSIVSKYMAAKAPSDPRDGQALDEVTFSPKGVARLLGAHFRAQLQWLDSKTRSAFVERPEAKVDALNSDKLTIKKYQWVRQQIESLGGVDRVFFNFLPTRAEAQAAAAPAGITMLPQPLGQYLHRAFDEYLKRDDVKNFAGGDGKTHQFSAQELELIQKTGHQYIQKIEEELLDDQLDALIEAKVDIESNFNKLAHVSDGIQAQFENRLREVAETILLSQRSDAHVNGYVAFAADKRPNVVVPANRYSHQLRLKAAKMLSAKMSATKGWSMNGRRNVTTQLLERLKSSLGEDVRKLPEAAVAQPLREWLMQQKEILTLLAAEPGCVDLLSPPKTDK